MRAGAVRALPGVAEQAGVYPEDGLVALAAGIATLEDKILQRAVAGVLNAVYEVDFRGFSYGFLRGRKPA